MLLELIRREKKIMIDIDQGRRPPIADFWESTSDERKSWMREINLKKNPSKRDDWAFDRGSTMASFEQFMECCAYIETKEKAADLSLRSDAALEARSKK